MLFFWIAAIGGSVIFFVADALSPAESGAAKKLEKERPGALTHI